MAKKDYVLIDLINNYEYTQYLRYLFHREYLSRAAIQAKEIIALVWGLIQYSTIPYSITIIRRSGLWQYSKFYFRFRLFVRIW